jgi:hypothetical protein
MSKATDLTGRRFGRLTVIEKTERKDKRGVRMWRCICDCGNEVFSTVSILNSGRKLSCGCIREEQALKPGERFGMLTLLYNTGKHNKKGSPLWLCKCDCGGEKEASSHNLKRGRTTHCGCKSLPEDFTGLRFGKLTALEYTEQRNKDGKRLWRCSCDCGNEKLVPAASLKNGSTKSCGCINHPSKIQVGGRYGKLTVLRRVENDKKGKPVYLCLCDCGREKTYLSAWLSQGRVTSCGCSQGVTPIDLTNKRFGHVVALSPTERRDGNAIVWECRCDCGKLTYRSHSSLKVSGENTSCGCLQSEISKANFKKAIHHVEDTCIEKLESTKPTARNTSGVRGVYWNARDRKWQATIGFQKKQIFLGRFDTLAEAAEARKRAEEEIYEPFLEAYYKARGAAALALKE